MLANKIFLRSSISVNSHTLTYAGLESVSGKIPSVELEKVDHGLVIMWASLANNFTPLVVVFAYKVNLMKGIRY